MLKLDVTNQGQINAAIKNSGPVNPVLRHGFYTRQKGAQFSCLQFLELGTLAFRTDSPFIYIIITPRNFSPPPEFEDMNRETNFFRIGEDYAQIFHCCSPAWMLW